MVCYFKGLMTVSLTVGMITLMACSGVVSKPQSSWTEVPISDITSLAGKWEGVTWTEPRRGGKHEDWVKVGISKSGQYKFASYRLIGVWLGSGNLLLEDGKLVTESKPDAGSATFTLFQSNGERMLKVQGVTKGGIRQSAELKPAKN